jgi:hypothetical protein
MGLKSRICLVERTRMDAEDADAVDVDGRRWASIKLLPNVGPFGYQPSNLQPQWNATNGSHYATAAQSRWNGNAKG